MKRVLITSPFITYKPNSKSIKGLSYSFHLSLLDKRKVGGDSYLPQYLQYQNAKPVLTVSSATVSHSLRSDPKTGNLGKKDHLGGSETLKGDPGKN